MQIDSNFVFNVEIILLRIEDVMISILISLTDIFIRNSGIVGGKFLERTRVAKPGCDPNKPEYYGPRDFAIGSVIVVYGHKFVITDADDYVFHHVEVHNSQFPSEVIESMRIRKAEKDQVRQEQQQKELKKTKNMAAPIRK